MKLFKFDIVINHYGNYRINLFVLADSEINAKKLVYKDPRYRDDPEALIVSIKEIDLNDSNNRIL